MVLMVAKEKEVNAIKEYLKQIEEETIEMADRLKLDAQKRWGLEDKFKHAYTAIENLLKTEEPEKPKVAKIDVKTGIKRVS
jgi:hypothetical protein